MKIHPMFVSGREIGSNGRHAEPSKPDDVTHHRVNREYGDQGLCLPSNDIFGRNHAAFKHNYVPRTESQKTFPTPLLMVLSCSFGLLTG